MDPIIKVSTEILLCKTEAVHLHDDSQVKASQLPPTEGPIFMNSHVTGPKFEVKLKKNSSGLGFSFVQMERGNCSHLKSDLVRIKRLFPGQPAEEHGAIAAGDIILAVNGKSIEGLAFQVLSSAGGGKYRCG